MNWLVSWFMTTLVATATLSFGIDLVKTLVFLIIGTQYFFLFSTVRSKWCLEVFRFIVYYLLYSFPRDFTLNRLIILVIRSFYMLGFRISFNRGCMRLSNLCCVFHKWKYFCKKISNMRKVWRVPTERCAGGCLAHDPSWWHQTYFRCF